MLQLESSVSKPHDNGTTLAASVNSSILWESATGLIICCASRHYIAPKIDHVVSTSSAKSEDDESHPTTLKDKIIYFYFQAAINMWRRRRRSVSFEFQWVKGILE